MIDYVYFTLLCLLIIICAVALMFFIDKKDLFSKKFFVLYLVIFLFLFGIFVNKDNNNEHSQEIDRNILELNNKYSLIKKLKSDKNKVIIIGDSRMAFLYEDENVFVPKTISFIAKPGARIDWFNNVAVQKLKLMLDNGDNDILYSIIINMGVNDLASVQTGITVADKYYDIYKEIALDYSNVMVYILSINPLDEKNYYLTEPPRASNDKIRIANARFQENLKNDNIKNMYFCNSYKDLKFGIYDGIHYDSETNKKILNYIINDCVMYK